MKEGIDQLMEGLKETHNYWSHGDDYANKVQRKIKTVNGYRLVEIDGSLRKISRRMDLIEFKGFMNLNKSNQICGYTPDYIGFRKSKPVFFKNIIAEYISDNLPTLKDRSFYNDLIKSLTDYREVYSGSPDSNMGHLRNFFLDNTTKRSTMDIVNIIKDSPWIGTPEINYDQPGEMYWLTNFNPKANPGHYTSRILKSMNKGYTHRVSIKLALDKYNYIKKFPVKNYNIWDVFSREKDSKLGSSTDYSTRVVLNTEESEVILLSWVFNKMLRVYEFNGSNFKFKASIKGEFDNVKVNKLIDKFDNYDFYVDADWSKFDSSIDTQYLEAAGLIMFSGIAAQSDEMERLSYHMMSSFITKFIAIPPGVVVELNRGNPSGHPCVTILNCIVNIMRWIIIGYRIYGEKYYEFMDIDVYGDDALIFFKNNENLINIDDYCAEEGFIGDKVFHNMFPCEFALSEVDNQPDFLKRRFGIDKIVWNNKKLFDKLIYQSKKRNYVDQVELLNNFVITAPGNDDINYLFIEMIRDFIHKGYIDFDYGNGVIHSIKNSSKHRFNPMHTHSLLSGYNFEKNVLGKRFAEKRKKINYEVFNDLTIKFMYLLNYPQDILNLYRKELIKNFISRDELKGCDDINDILFFRPTAPYKFMFDTS